MLNAFSVFGLCIMNLAAVFFADCIVNVDDLILIKLFLVDDLRFLFVFGNSA